MVELMNKSDNTNPRSACSQKMKISIAATNRSDENNSMHTEQVYGVVRLR